MRMCLFLLLFLLLRSLFHAEKQRVACVAHVLQLAVQEMLGCKDLDVTPPDEPLELGMEDQDGQELFSVDFGDEPGTSNMAVTDVVDSSDDDGSEEDDEAGMRYGTSYIYTHGNPVQKLRDGITKLR